MPVWSSPQDGRCSTFKLTCIGPKSYVLDLLTALLSHPAARALQSRNGGGDLRGDLAFFLSQIRSDVVSVQSTIQLLTQVTKHAPDVAIWNAVFALVAKPVTTPNSCVKKLEPDTPCKSNTSSQRSSEQTHADMDEFILQEVNLCLFENTKGFYEKYFEGKSWSSSVARFAQKVNPPVLDGRWAGYPHPPTQTAFLKWFGEFTRTFPSEIRNQYYTSFNKPIHGSGCNRQPNIFLTPRNTCMFQRKYYWRDVRVIGKLNESVSSENRLEIAQFCGYAREVFTSQPTRLFLHGFILRGSIMEMWVCDRSGPYSCERFDAHKDPARFIKVMLAYTMMSDEELGLNMFIKEDDVGKWIMIKGEGQAKEERLDLEDQPIALQRGIVCRGTTCYRAKRQGASLPEFVVKFSWRSYKRRAEGELLQLAKKMHVWGVAEIFGHRDLTRVSDLRHGLQFGKPRSFLSVCGGSSDPTQPALKSGNLKGNLSWDSSVGSTTTLEPSSLLGQKRKAGDQAAATCPFKRPRSSAVRPTDPASKAAEKPKSTSLIPSKNHESFDDRIFCCLVVSPPGRAIDRFNSIEEFLEACRDAIKGHQSLYQNANILHRDVSKNNIIIADAENDGDPKGMLIDLDLAKELNTGPSGGRHRTGTMEFMAVEVLQGHTHTYRHDLESFLYVFLWTIICYDPESGERSLAGNSKLRRWFTGTYGYIADIKRSHMEKFGFKSILYEFPDIFYGLKELAEELRLALFPIRDGGLYAGTFANSKKLYKSMIDAFDKAIDRVRAETK